jgi:imidazoleglycerol-phosphate dehydratase
MATTGQGRTNVRVNVAGAGQASVETGIAVLDHLLSVLAAYASFDIALEVEPGSAEVEILGAARALGESLSGPLRANGARGYGSAVLPADEALAQVVLETSERAAVFSNVDLSQARVGGLATDVAARFLDQLTLSAGLVVHVRLIEGSETQHVLDAIFKALGAALGEACRPRVAR